MKKKILIRVTVIFIALLAIMKFQTVEAKETENKIIIVGDSRVASMETFVDNEDYNVYFIGGPTKTYDWFEKEAVKEINKVKNPGDSIVIWMGTNDYRMYDIFTGYELYEKYAKLYNKLAEKRWADCDVYVASVGYVDKTKIMNFYTHSSYSNIRRIGVNSTVSGIRGFNKKLKQELSDEITWIDLNKTIGLKANDGLTDTSFWYVRDNGKVDGLHYSEEVTKKAFDYIMKVIEIANYNEEDVPGTDELTSRSKEYDANTTTLLSVKGKKKPTYTVSPKTETLDGKYENSSAYNKYTKPYFMLRSYLQQLEAEGGGTLVLKKGTYNITNTLYVPSNVTIKLKDGVVIKKTTKTGSSSFPSALSLFQLVEDSNYQGSTGLKKGYKGASNISFIGEGKAVIDMNDVKGSLGIIAVHNKDVLVKGIQFKNSNTGHFLEVDAVDGMEISKCTFVGSTASEKQNKEAINIDTPDPLTGGCNVKWTSHDRTANKNILIQDNYFSKLDRAIGTHKYSMKADKTGKYTVQVYHSDITIKNNKFEDIRDSSIFAMSWKDCEIENNTFSNSSAFSGVGVVARGSKDITVANSSFKSGFTLTEFKDTAHRNIGDKSANIYDEILNDLSTLLVL